MDATCAADDALRDRLGALLQGGLPTEWRDRADSSSAVNAIVARLGAVARDDPAGLLSVAGFSLAPYPSSDADDIAQACETCMYYATHRRYCELPELRLPVRPEWSCRLWRI